MAATSVDGRLPVQRKLIPTAPPFYRCYEFGDRPPTRISRTVRSSPQSQGNRKLKRRILNSLHRVSEILRRRYRARATAGVW